MKESIKQTVQQRALFCCEYCLAQANISADSFVMEHIIPVIKGGATHIDNLVVSQINIVGLMDVRISRIFTRFLRILE